MNRMNPTYRSHAYTTPRAVLGVFFLALFCTVPSAHAMVVRGGEAYEVGEGSTLEGDLYFAGKTFSVAGTSTDDVFAVGSDLSQTGRVLGDVFSLGGTVSLGGYTRGDARIIGGEVTVASSTVTEDLIVLGGNIVIEKGSVVEGDLLVYGDRLVINGEVRGNVEAHVRALEMRGTVGHDATFTIRESISLTDKAQVLGVLAYRAPRAAFISDTVTIAGETSFEETPVSDTDNGFNPFRVLFGALVMAVGAVLLVKFFPHATSRAVNTALNGGAFLAVQGFITLIAWPLLSIFVCVTILGLLPGLTLLSLYGVMVFVSMAVTPVVAGVALARWLKKGDGMSWDWAVIGALCLSAMLLLPVIGMIVRTLLFVVTFGAVTSFLFESVQQYRAKNSAPAVPSDLATPVTPSHEVTTGKDSDSPEK
jgi:cytoskeletal protein CcmA (bactofilin family)